MYTGPFYQNGLWTRLSLNMTYKTNLFAGKERFSRLLIFCTLTVDKQLCILNVVETLSI